MSKRTGQRCKRAPSRGRDVCRMHGGATPLGPASPHWVDGRYSTILPSRMLERYREAESDEERLALDAEIALIDARINDVLSRVDTGESGRLWSQLRRSSRRLASARRAGDPARVNTALGDIGNLIDTGHADWAAWADVQALIRERVRLVKSERKRLVEAQQLISIEQAMTLLGLLVDAVRLHVRDETALRAVTDEFARLTGVPSPAAQHVVSGQCLRACSVLAP